MEFQVLLEAYLEDEIRPDVEKLLDMKINTPEITVGKRFDRVNAYFDRTISEFEMILAKLTDDAVSSWDELNSLFLTVLR